MGLAIVYSRAQDGINSPLVTVEVHISGGLPGMSIVGLPETAVKESKDRVRSAIMNSRFDFPGQRITINLAPADLPKEGGRFDLPIAIGILAATHQLPKDQLEHYEFAGELALSGKLRSISGALPFALATKGMKRALIIAKKNAAEAGLVEGIDIYPATHLLDVCAHLTRQTLLKPYQHLQPDDSISYFPDLCEVKGQQQAKRALEVAAAGGHNLLLTGPPGTGKTMLASRLPGILPLLTDQQAIEVATIGSICGLKHIHKSFKKPPLRHPHHTASAAALVGGGTYPKPGEISLAHHGVLFLDELPEFDRKVLEVLREPIESGTVTISRANSHAEFPACFQLIAACNPCPCCYLGSTKKTCQCSPLQIQRYRAKLSGPLLDRIDLHLEVPDLAQHELTDTRELEKSDAVKARVRVARDIQLTRQQTINSRLSASDIEKYCALAAPEKAFIENAMQRLQISARAYHRILKVTRTIADLDGKETISTPHLTEALSYRRMEH